MTSQFVDAKLELGHRAKVKEKPSEEGYTHDWTVFVRGADGSQIQHYVDKVVFYLHESFPKPRRVLKEPPYQVSECGYAGFNMPIEVYFKNKEEPKKVGYDYDLFLVSDAPVNNIRHEKLTFQNPTEEFRRKIWKAGGGVAQKTVPTKAVVKDRPAPPQVLKQSLKETCQIDSPIRDAPKHSSKGSSEECSEKIKMEKERIHTEKKPKPQPSVTKTAQKPALVPSQPFSDIFGVPINKAEVLASSTKNKEFSKEHKSSKSIPATGNTTVSAQPTKEAKSSAKEKDDKKAKSQTSEHKIKPEKLSKESKENVKRPSSAEASDGPSAKKRKPSLPTSSTSTVSSQEKVESTKEKVKVKSEKEKLPSSSVAKKEVLPPPREKDSSSSKVKHSKSDKDVIKSKKESVSTSVSTSSNSTSEKKENKKEKESNIKKEKETKKVEKESSLKKEVSIKVERPSSDDKAQLKKDVVSKKEKSHSKESKKESSSIKKEKSSKPVPKKIEEPSKITPKQPKKEKCEPIPIPSPSPTPPPDFIENDELVEVAPKLILEKRESPALDFKLDDKSSDMLIKNEDSSPSSSISLNSLPAIGMHGPLAAMMAEMEKEKELLSPMSSDPGSPPILSEALKMKDVLSDIDSLDDSLPSLQSHPLNDKAAEAAKPSIRNEPNGDGYEKPEPALLTEHKTLSKSTQFDPEYLAELIELQTRIMSLRDRKHLQKIVDLIEETGQYHITSSTFDFDLCALDQSIVKKLQSCLTVK